MSAPLAKISVPPSSSVGEKSPPVPKPFRIQFVFNFFYLCSCRSSSVNFWGGGGGKFGGNVAGFYLTHRAKAQTFQGNFRSIFRKKIRSSKNLSCQLCSADVSARQYFPQTPKLPEITIQNHFKSPVRITATAPKNNSETVSVM